MVSSDKRDHLKDSFGVVKDDLRKLRTDTGTLAKDAYDVGCCSAGEAKDALQESLKAATAKGKVGLSLVRDQVGTRPVAAVAVAFGVGLAAGLFLLGSRD